MQTKSTESSDGKIKNTISSQEVNVGQHFDKYERKKQSIDADWLQGMNSVCCITRDRNYSVNNEELRGVSARTRPG